MHIKRVRSAESPLTAQEIAQYRSVLGSLQYIATWVRWDIACAVSMCAQRTTKATVADAKALNEVVRLAVDRPDLGVLIRRNCVNLADCEIIC